ncbi:hypothetical protein C8Q80DRAFT_1191254 [Daedaleopsis nitida]|nr:hypothetical protein C8Q80DRAFT_1191254 [Daedaleopsis nitida]
MPLLLALVFVHVFPWAHPGAFLNVVRLPSQSSILSSCKYRTCISVQHSIYVVSI